MTNLVKKAFRTTIEEFQNNFFGRKNVFFRPEQVVILLDGMQRKILRRMERDAKEKKHTKEFQKIIVKYPSLDTCRYPKDKWMPYYEIMYKENGEEYTGYGTHNIDILSGFIRYAFINEMEPDYMQEDETDAT